MLVSEFGSAPLGLALDEALNVYVAGSTSPNFPITPGVLQPDYVATSNTAFVAKLNPTGTALIYSTYLGGHLYDWINAIAVDGVGNAYLTGVAGSTDFPTTPGAFQSTCPIAYNLGERCSIAFVTKINSTASSIVYSTFLGGRDPNGYSSGSGEGIAVDGSGFAYVTGPADNNRFPTTAGSLKPSTLSPDAFVSKLNLDGTGLVYSTFLGGDRYRGGGYGREDARDIVVDTSGNAYVVGMTASYDFPLVDPLQPKCGLADAYVAEVNPQGSALKFSTCLGGSGQDWGYGVAIDAAGAIYVAGLTSSTDFPLVDPAQPSFTGAWSSFVTKIGIPACGEITYQLDVAQSRFHEYLFGLVQFQWVLVHNKTSTPFAGPLSLVIDDAQNAVFIGSNETTNCFPPGPDRFRTIPVGDDGVLSPNESRLASLWFFKTGSGAITYVPRVLSGLPSR